MAFGIDFGTTNSAVVYNRNTRLGIADGRPFPSVVAVSKMSDRTYCGTDAVARINDDGFEVIRSVKRYLDEDTTFVVGGKVYYAFDIVRILFAGLRDHVQTLKTEGGRAVEAAALDEAVVSVPVNFHPLRRKLLREAAAAAGVRIIDFVSEPTAAFIHCRDEMPPFSRVAVFDWGGGTLDVAVLRVDADGKMHEIASAVGYEAGMDIDEAIAMWVHERAFIARASAEAPVPPLDRVSTQDRARMLTRCENAKILLGSEPSASVTLPRYAGLTNVAVEVTREQLRDIVRPFVARALATLDQALKDAAVLSGGGRHGVDQVLLIGGSAQLVALQEGLREHFPGRVFGPNRPDWAVAQGASWLAERPGSYRLAQSIGLVLADGRAHTIARLGDTFATDLSPQYLGVVDGRETAQLVFAEVEDGEALNNTTGSGVRRHLFNLEVPTQGMLDEVIRLDVRLTENLTLKVRGRSENNLDEDAREKEWAELRCTFRMPERRHVVEPRIDD